jgi:hypothetical protein
MNMAEQAAVRAGMAAAAAARVPAAAAAATLQPMVHIMASQSLACLYLLLVLIMETGM